MTDTIDAPPTPAGADAAAIADPETARVDAAISAFLDANDPASMSDVEFRGRRYDAGLAWVHFAEGFGGMGVRPNLNGRVEKAMRAAGAAPGDPSTFFMALAGPTIVTHGTDDQKQAVPAADVHR